MATANLNTYLERYADQWVISSVTISQLFSVKHKQILCHLAYLTTTLDADAGDILIQPVHIPCPQAKVTGTTTKAFYLNRAGFELACRRYTDRQAKKWKQVIMQAFAQAEHLPSAPPTTPAVYQLNRFTFTSTLQELKTLARVMNQQGLGFYAGEVLRIRDQIAQGYQLVEGGAA